LTGPTSNGREGKVGKGSGREGKGRGEKRMEGEWKGNGAPTYKGRERRGKRETEGPPVITVSPWI